MHRADKQYKQAGSSLPLVLWFSVLLALLLASLMAFAQITVKRQAIDDQILRSQLANDGALNLVAFRLAEQDKTLQMPVTVDYEEISVTVKFSDSYSLIDLNLASEKHFANFFKTQTYEEDAANSLAANIADWRDTDDLSRINGAEKRDYDNPENIGNRDFQHPLELYKVKGIDETILECPQEHFTVFGGHTQTTDQEIIRAQMNTGNRGSLTAIATFKEKSTISPQQKDGVFFIHGKAPHLLSWVYKANFGSIGCV